MATETKTFAIKTIYDSQGLKQYSNDLKIARSVSRRFSVELSDNAKILEQTTSRSFNRAGQAVDRTSAIISDSGRKIRVVYDRMADRTRFVSASFVKFRDNVATTGLELRKLVTRAGLVIPVWLALRSAFTGVLNVIRESLRFMIDWEFQMAQVRIVSDNSEEALNNLSRSLLNLSKNLGISNKDLAEGGKLYVQQGRSIEEIIPLMDATAKLSLLTGRTITQSVEDMTAVLKAYKLEATDAANIVNEITNVMLNHAITAGDLAAAYKATASTASTLGLSLEALTGFITAIKTETRDSGNKVGLSIRTMLSRITTSSVEALQQITQVPFFIDEMGRATTDVTPNLRNLETILTEIASKFDDLGNAQQSQVAKLIGGVRRQNQVFALFNNFTEGIEAQADALFSLGKAESAIEILTDTMELRIKRLQGTWDQFVDAFADTAPLKKATGALTEIIEGLTLAVNPDAFKENTLIEELTSRQNQALEKVGFAENLLKARKRALELQESLRNNRINLEEANAEAQIFAERINKAGRAVNFDLGNIETLDEFIAELERRQTEIRQLAVTQNITALREGLRQDLVNTAAEIRTVVKSQTDRFNLANLVTPGVGDLLNRISLGVSPQEIRGIADSLEFEGTIDELNRLRDTFRDILNPKEFESFDKLLTRFGDIGQQIGRVDQKAEQFARTFDELSRQTTTIELKNLITPESIQRELEELQLALAGANLSDLEVTRQKLDILEKNESVLNDTQTRLLQNLRVQERQLVIEEQKTDALSRQRLALNRLRNRGATNLQILIQELAFLDQIGVKEEEIRKKREQIALERQNVERSAVDSIVDAQIDLLKIQGQSELELIKTRIELEKRLGIEREGLDALQQQLNLAKAIAKENQKSREDRLGELRQAIIDRRKAESPSREARLDFQESNLTFQAKFAGFSQEEIDKILRPTEDVDNLLPNSLENLTRQNVDLTGGLFTLTRAVESLTDAVLKEESQRLDLASVRSLLGSGVQTEPFQPEPQKAIEPLPLITRGQTIGAGQNRLVEINVGNTQVFLNQDVDRSQIERFVTQALDEDNTRRKNEIISEIARQLRTPNSDLNKADRANFENF